MSQQVLHFLGQFCSNCGIGCCVQATCIKKANTTHICKAVSVEPKDQKFRHHWIPGNLPLHSECEVCEEVCGDGPGIVDLKCCWCQRTVHNQCQSQMGEVCDFGEFRKFIVSPQLVKTSKKNRKIIEQVNQDPDPDWKPIIVIGNKKSGNKDCISILAAFRSQLNPAQVRHLQIYFLQKVKWDERMNLQLQIQWLIILIKIHKIISDSDTELKVDFSRNSSTSL